MEGFGTKSRIKRLLELQPHAKVMSSTRVLTSWESGSHPGRGTPPLAYSLSRIFEEAVGKKQLSTRSNTYILQIRSDIGYRISIIRSRVTQCHGFCRERGFTVLCSFFVSCLQTPSPLRTSARRIEDLSDHL